AEYIIVVLLLNDLTQQQQGLVDGSPEFPDVLNLDGVVSRHLADTVDDGVQPVERAAEIGQITAVSRQQEPMLAGFGVPENKKRFIRLDDRRIGVVHPSGSVHQAVDAAERGGGSNDQQQKRQPKANLQVA